MNLSRGYKNVFSLSKVVWFLESVVSIAGRAREGGGVI